MHVLRNLCRLVAFALLLALFPAMIFGPALAAQEILTDGTTSMGGTATFDLGDESGTVTEANPGNWGGLVGGIGRRGMPGG